MRWWVYFFIERILNVRDIIENNRFSSSNRRISKDSGKKSGRYNHKTFYSTRTLFSEFFGVDPSFPADQLMSRHSNDRGRNIYFVSDYLKQIVTSNQDRIKVYSFFSLISSYRFPSVYQYGCSFTCSN